MSGTAPFAKLAITIPAGVVAVGSGEPVASVKVPSKLLLPSKTETVLSPWFTTARSGTPSAFRSPVAMATGAVPTRSEEHTSELQSRLHLVCRLLLEKKNTTLEQHSNI